MFLRILLLTTMLASFAYTSEYAVVIKKDVPIQKLSIKQIKDIFLLKRHFVEDVKIIPVNITASSQIRKEFELKVIKINRNKLNKYWIKKHFQGITPPMIQSSQNSMKLFLKNVAGSIGYLPLEIIDSDFKILYEF